MSKHAMSSTTMRRVAVTGASGFVGRHLVAELLSAGVEVTAVVRATSNTARLQGAKIAIAEMSQSRPLASQPASVHSATALPRPQLIEALAGCDVVFHLAGAVDFGGEWKRFQQVNVGGTANVLSAARAAGVRRVVHCSSIVAVGAATGPYLLSESAKWNLGSLRVPYVSTKRAAEVLALRHNDRDLEVVVANPAAVIGPGDTDRSEFGTLCERFWRGKLPIHFGGGNNFVDVRDVAHGLRLCAARGAPGQRYILGGANRTMSAFFSELARAAGRPVPRFRLPTALAPITATIEATFDRRPRRRAYLSVDQSKLLPYFFYYDCGKARRELGWHARPLHESLADAHREFKTGRAA